MTNSIRILSITILTMISVVVFSESSSKEANLTKIHSSKTYTLEEIGDIIQKNQNILTVVSGKHLNDEIRLKINSENLDFQSLYPQLDAHGFTIVKTDDSISIISSRLALRSPIKLVNDNDEYNDYEFVTDVIELKKLCPAQLLSTLRPLVRVRGALFIQNESRALIVSETYSKVNTLRKVVEELESRATQSISDCIAWDEARVKNYRKELKEQYLKDIEKEYIHKIREEYRQELKEKKLLVDKG